MKSMKNLVLVLLVALCVASSLWSQGTTSVVGYYDSELFKINYNTFGGLSINYQGQSASVTYGIPPNFKSLLSKYADTKVAIQAYSDLNLGGNLLIWGGVGALAAAMYYPLLSLYSSPLSTSTVSGTLDVSVYLYLGGLLAETLGALIMPAGFERLTQAVNSFNRHKLEEFGR
jgi:hypothetical protein